MKLIFLDIDGVLNDHEPFENGYCGTKPSCIRSFNRILGETGAKIVVSSAWRYLILSVYMNKTGFENLLLTHGVNCHEKIIDTTEPDAGSMTRGEQIHRFLRFGQRSRNLEVESYVVLDNGDGVGGDLGIDVLHRGHFVWTTTEIGLDDADADRAIAILKKGETS